MAKKKRTSEDLTVDYRTIMSMPPGIRRQLVATGSVDPLLGVLTPGQRVALFPDYFKQQLSGLAGQKGEFATPGKAGQGYSQTSRWSSAPRTSPPSGVPVGSLPPQTQTAVTNAGTSTNSRPIVGNFTDREKATLRFISAREGANDPNIIFGGERYKSALGLDKKPLTSMTVNEVLEMQRKMTKITAADGVAGGRGTSAVGTGQMIRSTLIANLQALGIPESDWDKITFTEELQNRLTLQNFKSSGIGDPNADPSTWNKTVLGQQYESLDTNKGFRPMSREEMQAIAAASPELKSEMASNDIPLATPEDDTLPIGGQENSATAVPEAVMRTGGIPYSAAMSAVDRALTANGLHERENKELLKEYLQGGTITDPASQAWCAAFVNASLASAGLKGTGSNIANSFQTYGMGVDDPTQTQKGDIVVRTGGGGPGDTGGHVMMATGNTRINPETGAFEIEIVGGNQSSPEYRGEGSVAVSTQYVNPQGLVVRRATEANLANPPPMFEGPQSTGADPVITAEAPSAPQTDQTANPTANPTGEPSTLGTDVAVGAASLAGGWAGAGGGVAHVVDKSTSAPGNSRVGSWINENIPGAAYLDDLAYRASGGYVGTSMSDPRYSWNQSTSSMAAGGVLKEPHTAINNRTGERVNLGEVGTGGEAIVPMNKVRASEVGQQPYQMPEIPKPDARIPMGNETEIKNMSASTKNATGQTSTPSVTIMADHQMIPPSARKAYADAGLEKRFNNFSSIGTQYRSFGI